ncbi:glycosyltransferase [Puniceicoccaceae bacterium]|nr:glycosyltransferase [Puniceicoccaceae bacterium]
MSNPKVCILVCDLAPYHEARFNAAAALGDLVVLDVGKDIDTAYDAPEQLRFPIIQVGPAKLEAQLTEIRPDVLVVPGWGSAIAQRGMLWALRNDCPVVTFSDSQLEGQPRSWLQDSVKRQLVSIFDSALVAGGRARRYMQYFGMPSTVIFDGVDVVDNAHFAQHAQLSAAQLSAARDRLALPTRYLFSVNRFVAQKNLSGLVTAYTEYVNNGHAGGLELVIAGDGELRSELVAQIQQLGVTGKVHLLGRVGYQDLPMLYRLADAFVIASNSHSETWGLTVNEAMAAACPVLVSTSCGSSEDLVEHSVNGYTFAANAPAELAQIFEEVGSQQCDLVEMGARATATIAKWDVALFACNLWASIAAARTHARPPRRLAQLILRALLFKSAIR